MTGDVTRTMRNTLQELSEDDIGLAITSTEVRTNDICSTESATSVKCGKDEWQSYLTSLQYKIETRSNRTP